MTERMTLEDVETAIYEQYRWFSVVAPGVQPQETGRLGELWAMFDELVEA